MSINFPRSGVIATAGLFAGLLFAGGALAQQAAPAAPAAGAAQQPAQPAGPIVADLIAVQPTWTKVCGSDPASKKQVCYTTRDFGAKGAKEGDPPQPLLALAVYDPTGEDTKIIRLLLPPGLMLRPGFRFAIDKGSMESGTFEICFPNGCFAEAKIKKAVVDGMKKASTMTVIVKNQGNAEVTFHLPLTDFGKAFDGPAIDPKVLEEQQKQLQEQLQKKAEEERKKLEAQKGAAAPAPAPAPAK